MKVKNTISFLVLLSVVFLLISSCSKEPGPGGTSSVSGKVYVKNYNASFTTLLGEYYAQEQRVYLIYGENDTHSDDVRTNYDGTFRFDNLRKGNYQVYVYSKDSTQTIASGYEPVIKTFEITANNQHIVLEDIIILD